MKKQLLKNLIITTCLGIIPFLTYAQVGTSFSEPTAGTGNYTDPNTTDHQLVNNVGQPTVEYIYGTNASSELGFKTAFFATRTAGTGLSDGDLVGVVTDATFTGSSGFAVGSGNVFMIEDPDGTVQIEFDQVDLTGTTNPQLSLKYGINSTSYEISSGANDRIYIALKIEGNPTFVTILDSDGDGTIGGNNGTGNSIEGVLTEEVEQTINFSLVPYIGQKVSLIIEADTNSGAEEFAFDDISFSEGSRVPTTYTWTGTSSNSWTTNSNWDLGVAPPAGENIIIPSGLTNYPTISSAVTVNSIQIASGATLIANAQVNGTATYTRNLPTTNWYLVSSPLSGESIDDVTANNDLASGTGGNLGLGFYLNNGAIPWVYALVSSNRAIDEGEGMSIKLANPGNFVVSGNVNSSTLGFNISTGSRNNFNLVGNPYLSFVNSATLASDNTSELTEETVWLWNGTEYVTYNAVSPIEIAPGQGFFIEASSTGSLVTFVNSNQSHQSTDTFLRQESHPSFELFVTNGNENTSTKVFYVNNKTTGFDNGYDSKMFGGIDKDFAIFTQLVSDDQGKKLAIQTLPNADHATMIIPVGLTAKADQELTFSVSSTNLPSGIEIYLEDRVNNTFVNLSEGDHTILTKSNLNGIGQYYIHASSAKLSNEDITQNISNVSIYKSSENEITITGLQAKANVKVFSLLGEELIDTDINSNGISKVALPNLSTGVYVVKLNSALGNITKKIILE